MLCLFGEDLCSRFLRSLMARPRGDPVSCVSSTIAFQSLTILNRSCNRENSLVCYVYPCLKCAREQIREREMPFLSRCYIIHMRHRGTSRCCFITKWAYQGFFATLHEKFHRPLSCAGDRNNPCCRKALVSPGLCAWSESERGTSPATLISIILGNGDCRYIRRGMGIQPFACAQITIYFR